MRKLSRVFCECRRHRCKGLHWTPEGGEPKEEEEEEMKGGGGGGGGEENARAIYEPPIAMDFVAG